MSHLLHELSSNVESSNNINENDGRQNKIDNNSMSNVDMNENDAHFDHHPSHHQSQLDPRSSPQQNVNPSFTSELDHNKMHSTIGNRPITVAAMYCFTTVENPSNLRDEINHCCGKYIKGALIIAKEGINGTVAGEHYFIQKLLTFLREEKKGLFDDIDIKLSYCNENPFYRLRLNLKKEIITMGIDNLDTSKRGIHVDPKHWNEIISDPGTILLDTRNDYEVKLGTFENAINPHTSTFRAFPSFVNNLLATSNSNNNNNDDGNNNVNVNESEKANMKIAMFCTGGIRCEKASAYLLQQGYSTVYQLKGGILNYLEQIPPSESKWHGECYVFDQRTSVSHGVQPGNYRPCRSCRTPLSQEDIDHPAYVEGVTCPYCIDKISMEKKESSYARQKQIEIAKERGFVHLGYQKQPKKKVKRTTQQDVNDEGNKEASNQKC